MTDDKSVFVVFLDVDGVLNTKTTCVYAPSKMYKGVDDARVKILADSMKHSDVDGVVLTSTWKTLREDDEDYIYLVDKLKQYGIKLLGKTKEKMSRREEGILDYLEANPEIQSFVIIDDQHYGFVDHCKLWDSYIDTQGRGIEHSIFASKTPTIPALLLIDSIAKFSK